MSEKKEGIGNLSRRQFLKDAGLVVGGTAIGSVVFLSACGKETEVTKTVTTTSTTTTTAAGSTVTTTAAGATATVTSTVTKYVCPFDNQEFSTLAALKAHLETAHPGEGKLVTILTLDINGKQHKLTYGDDVIPGDVGAYDVYPWHTLSWTLREKLHMTGTKIGCDVGECGSCTVLLEGKPILSCMTLTSTCDGKKIETIESLVNTETGALHPIQEAFIENHGFQCGFCAPAAMMTAKALIAEKPNPTTEELTNAFSGVLCRCTGYLPIFQSTSSAAAKMRGA